MAGIRSRYPLAPPTNLGSDLKATFELLSYAKPISKNRFRSENKNLDSNAANFFGPVNGRRNSKFATAILEPTN